MLICPGIERLLLLPLGCGRLKSAELLRSRKTREVLLEMKRRNPDLYIILDGPALTDGVDAIVLSDFIDQTLFVIRESFLSAHIRWPRREARSNRQGRGARVRFPGWTQV